MRGFGGISRLEVSIVLVLLALQICILAFAGPDSLKGPDWEHTFSRLGPETRSFDYWLTPEAFSSNYWSVGYSAFVGLFLETQLSTTIWLQAVQQSMAVCLALMVYLFTFRFGLRTRLASLFLAATSPSLFWMAWNGGYEILLSFLLCLAVLLVWLQLLELSHLRGRTQFVISLISGLLLGLATLVASKSIIPSAAFVAALALLRFRWTWAVGIGAVSPLLAWAVRNKVVLGSFNPLNSNGPVNLWIGNNPNATLGGFMNPPELPGTETSFLGAAIRHVVSQPEFTVGLTLRKISRLSEPVYVYPSQLPPPAPVLLHFATAFIGLALLLLVVMYIFGRFWAAPPITPPVGLLAVVVVFFVAAPIPFLAEARFRTPVEPLVIAIAIPCLAYLAKRPFLTSNDPPD